jgi:flagellar assembly protein FliH
LEKDNFFSGVDFNISDYKFESFQVKELEGDEPKGYEFRDLKNVIKKEDLIQEKVLNLERKFSEKNNFLITPVVKEHRGIKKQEEIEKEKKIIREVQKRVDLLKQSALEEGKKEGIKLGKKEVFDNTKGAADQKLTSLSDMILDLKKGYKKILSNQKIEILNLLKSLTKWVIQRELKDDDGYLNRLLEQLISEVDSKSNLILHVSKDDFDRMPEVLQELEEKVGALSNVRLLLNHDIKSKGMILESENGIIKGTSEEQFEIIDKIFESINLENNNE